VEKAAATSYLSHLPTVFPSIVSLHENLCSDPRTVGKWLKSAI